MNIKFLTAVAAVAVATVYADSISIGYDEFGGADVPQDSTVSQTDKVVIGDGAKFIKAGKGTYELPLSKIDSLVPYELQVREGAVKLSMGDATPEVDITPPSCINDKASFWVDASANNGSLVLNENDEVTKWCDRRETNFDTPTLPYASPKDSANGTVSIPQTYVVAPGTNAVYFGGYNTDNKRYMKFKNGSSDLRMVGVRHVFAVHGAFECWCSPVGGDNNPIEWFASSQQQQMSGNPTFIGIRYMEAMPGSTLGRHYLNGVRFDPFVDTVQKGFQLWESEFLFSTGTFESFFNMKNAAKRMGGDYLSEVVMFTNELSVAERLDVQRYLIRKWNLINTKPNYELAGRVELAKEASADFEVTSGETKLSGVALSGSGAIKKTGAGALAFDRGVVNEYDGELDLAGGSLVLRRSMVPTLKVTAGDTINSVYHTANASMDLEGVKYENYWVEATKTHADGDRNVTKVGAYDARITAIPDDVRKLKVDGGVLTLAVAPGDKLLDSGAMYATIPNGDFEMPCPADNTYNRRTLNTSTAVNGWYGSQGLYITENYSPYDTHTSNPHSRDTISPFPIRQGYNALTINNNGCAYTKEAYFPKSGYYEMTVLESNRHLYNGCSTTSKSYNHVRNPSYAVKIGSAWNTATVRAERLMANAGPFAQVKIPLGYIEAGTYTFGFQNGPTDSSGATLILDDIKVRFIGEKEYETVVKVPNGDFESVTNRTMQYFVDTYTSTYPTVNRNFYPGRTNANEAIGWTFNNPNTAKPAVSVVSLNCTWMYYNTIWPTGTGNQEWLMLCNLADGLYGSFSMLIVGTDGSATTTFTVPAGTYQLRCKAALWGAKIDGAEYRKDPVLAANLNGTSLGTISVNQHIMRPLTWGTTVTYNEETEVTLTVSQTAASSMCMIDDFELVKVDTIAVYGEELVKNGSFEKDGGGKYDDVASSTGWTTMKSTFSSNGPEFTNPQYSYKTNPGANQPGQFGPTPYKGVAYVIINNDSGLYQDIVFKKGLYRMSFAVHSRSNGGYDKQPIEAFLVKSGMSVTNYIGWTKVENMGDVEHAWYFRVDSDGTYRFYIKGTDYWREQYASDGWRHSSQIDGVSIKRVRDTEAQPEVPSEMKVEVAAGAQLRLDYDGEVTVGQITLGGTAVDFGTEVSAENYPEYIQGRGVLKSVQPPLKGMLLLIR